MLEIARVPLPGEACITNAVHALESLRQREGDQRAFDAYLSSRGYDTGRGIHGMWENLYSEEEKRLFLLDCADYFHTALQNTTVHPWEYQQQTDLATLAETVILGAQLQEEWIRLDVLTAYLSRVRATGVDGKVLPDTGHMRSHLSALVDGDIRDGYFVVPQIDRVIRRVSPDYLTQGTNNLLSNGIDAYQPERPIGMFASGPKSWLAVIQDRGGELWAESRCPDKAPYALTIRPGEEGRFYEHIHRSGRKHTELPYSTRVEARVTLKPEEVYRLLKNIPFGPVAGDGVRLVINGIRPEEGIVSVYGNEDRSRTSRHEVRIWIDTNGVAVEDDGCGMPPQTLLALFAPRQGTKQLTVLSQEESVFAVKQYGYVELREYPDAACTVHFTRRTEPLFTLQLPKELRDLPHGELTLEFDTAIAPVSEGRGQSGIKILPTLPEAVRTLVEKVTTREQDPVKAVRIVSAISFAIRSLMDKASDTRNTETESKAIITETMTALAQASDDLLGGIHTTHNMFPNKPPFYKVRSEKPAIFIHEDLTHKFGGIRTEDPLYTQINPWNGAEADVPWNLYAAPLAYDAATAALSPGNDARFLSTGARKPDKLLPVIVDDREKITIVDRGVWQEYESLCIKERDKTLSDGEKMDLSLMRVTLQILVNPYVQTGHEDVSTVYFHQPIRMGKLPPRIAVDPDRHVRVEWSSPEIITTLLTDYLSNWEHEYGTDESDPESIFPVCLEGRRYFVLGTHRNFSLFEYAENGKPLKVFQSEKTEGRMDYVSSWLCDQQQGILYSIDSEDRLRSIPLVPLLHGAKPEEITVHHPVPEAIEKFRSISMYQKAVWGSPEGTYFVVTDYHRNGTLLNVYGFDRKTGAVTRKSQLLLPDAQKVRHTHIFQHENGIRVIVNRQDCLMDILELTSEGLLTQGEQYTVPVPDGSRLIETFPYRTADGLFYIHLLSQRDGHTVMVTVRDGSGLLRVTGEIGLPEEFDSFDRYSIQNQGAYLYQPDNLIFCPEDTGILSVLSVTEDGVPVIRSLQGDRYGYSTALNKYYHHLVQFAPWNGRELWCHDSSAFNRFILKPAGLERMFPDAYHERYPQLYGLKKTLESFLALGVPERDLIYAMEMLIGYRNDTPTELDHYMNILTDLRNEHAQLVTWLYDTELVQARDEAETLREYSMFISLIFAMSRDPLVRRDEVEALEQLSFWDQEKEVFMRDVLNRLDPLTLLPHIDDRMLLYKALNRMISHGLPQNPERMAENIRTLRDGKMLSRITREICGLDHRNHAAEHYRLSPAGLFFCGESGYVETSRTSLKFRETMAVPVPVMAFFATAYGARTLDQMEMVARTVYDCSLTDCAGFLNLQEYATEWKRAVYFTGQTGTEMRELYQNHQDAIRRRYREQQDATPGRIAVSYYLQQINKEDYAVLDISDNGCGLTDEAFTAFAVSGVSDKNSAESFESGEHGVGIAAMYREFDLVIADTVRIGEDGHRSWKKNIYRVTRENGLAAGLTLVSSEEKPVSDTTPTGSRFLWGKRTDRSDPRTDILRWQEATRKFAGMIPVTSRSEPLPDGTILPTEIYDSVEKNGRRTLRKMRDQHEFVARQKLSGNRSVSLYRSLLVAPPVLTLDGKWMSEWNDGWLELTHPNLRQVPGLHRLSVNVCGFPPTMDRGDIVQGRDTLRARIAQHIYQFAASERRTKEMPLNEIMPHNFRTDAKYLMKLVNQFPVQLKAATILNQGKPLSIAAAREISAFTDEEMTMFLACLETTDRKGRKRSDVAEAVAAILNYYRTLPEGEYGISDILAVVSCKEIEALVSPEALKQAKKTIKSDLMEAVQHEAEKHAIEKHALEVTEKFLADPWYTRTADDSRHVGNMQVTVWKNLPGDGVHGGDMIYLSDDAVIFRADAVPVHEDTHGMQDMLEGQGIVSAFTHTSGGVFNLANKLTATSLLHKRLGNKKKDKPINIHDNSDHNNIDL